MLRACISPGRLREFHHAEETAMPNFVLIAVGTLVPIVALTLAFACGRARERVRDAAADISSEGFADDSRS
jgi:hypothetical protein